MSDPIDDLSKRITALKEDETGGEMGKEINQFSIAMRLSVELLAGVLVGALIGYWLDAWWGTEPWVLIVFVFIGFIAGIFNMKRSMDALDKPSK